MSPVRSVNPILASSRGMVSHSLWPLLLTILLSTTIFIHANPIPFNAAKNASNSDAAENAADSKPNNTTLPQGNDDFLTANSTSSDGDIVTPSSSTSSKGNVSEGKKVAETKLVISAASSSSSSKDDVSYGKKITENEFAVHYLQQFHYIEPGAMTSEDGAVKKLKKFQVRTACELALLAVMYGYGILPFIHRYIQ